MDIQCLRVFMRPNVTFPCMRVIGSDQIRVTGTSSALISAFFMLGTFKVIIK